MSPHAANSLIGDLVEMAKAAESMPILQSQLKACEEKIAEMGAHIQRLELRAHDYKAEIEGLHSQIRTLEVSRDDAELRFLEADDRTEKALAFVRSVFGNAGQLLQALEPPKAEEPKEVEVTSSAPSSAYASDGAVSPGEQGPLAQPEAASIGSQGSPQESGERAADPTANSPFGNESQIVASQDAETKEDAAPRTIAEGQSEVPPTAQASPEPVNSTSAMSQDGAEQDKRPDPAKPYVGKKYHDHPYYVSLSGWLAGGGTEESYHWRPEARGVA